jgi:3-hydroxyisobutyrate dehydrogenase-like beta-hydroxyacid dehydrogenase
MAKSSKTKSKSSRKSKSAGKKAGKKKPAKKSAPKKARPKPKKARPKKAEAKKSAPARKAKGGSSGSSSRRRSRSSRRRIKVAFLGQGLMGVPMAARLIQAGFSLQVWNRHPEKCRDNVEAGATRAENPAAAAKGADVVILMVSDDAALDTVLFGEFGASRGLKRGAVVVNCSTTSPGIAFRAATALRSLSVRYLEAPVMRSVQAAREGKLQILVGGSSDDLAKARKVLESLGADIHHVGDVGKAATLKLACNVLLAALTQAFAEYFVLARKNGVPFETMMEVLHAGPLNCQALRDAEQIVVNPGGRPNFYLRHMHNDLNLALELAQQLDLPLPVTAAIRQLLAAAENLGMAEKDFGALVELMSKWSAVAMRG